MRDITLCLIKSFPQVRARKLKSRIAEKRGNRGAGKSVYEPKASLKASSGRPSPVSNQQAAQRSLSFSGNDRILVVGDGDFSFSKGLVGHIGGTGDNLVLTSFDSANELTKKYPQAKANVDFVRKSGAVVRHGVDATKLEEAFPGELFDCIVFNFPHSGWPAWLCARRLLIHDGMFLNIANNPSVKHAQVYAWGLSRAR